METAVVLAAAATVSDLMVGFEPKPPGQISCARPKTGASNTTARTAHASFFIDGSFGDEFSGSAKGPGLWPYPGVAVGTGIPALCRAAQTLKQRVSIQLAFRHGFSPQLDNAGGDKVEVLMGVLAAKRLGARVGLVVVALQAGALIGLVGGCVMPFRDDGNLIGPAYLAAAENPNVLTDFHAGTRNWPKSAVIASSGST